MNPKVSIIIPFYNCAYVDKAVASAIGQTFPYVEIIVVDDGSTQYREKLDPFMANIHYIGKANGGTASALNYGIGLAKGEYVAWLSSDDLFYPAKIERQLRFMTEHKASISFTSFDEINAHGKIVKRNLGPHLNRWQELYRIFPTANPVNGCTVVMKKELFDAVGPFDQTLIYTHDYDLWIRILLQGVPFHYLPEPLIKYRVHKKMGTIKHHLAIQKEIKSIRDRFSDSLIQMANKV